MIKECDIYTLLNASDIPVIDVRSPAEFNHAHIPGAINIPLFNDEERKTVGIIYKQESKTKAIETGLDLAGKKLSMFIREAKAIAKIIPYLFIVGEVECAVRVWLLYLTLPE